MLNTPVPTSFDVGSAMLVSLSSRPGDVAYSSDLNVAWNQRTLVLMARAGLIRFACVPPPECYPNDGEMPEAFEPRRAQAFEFDALTAAVEITDVGHYDEATWKERVEPWRRWLRDQDDLTLARMEELVAGKASPDELFQDVYTVKEAKLYRLPAGSNRWLSVSKSTRRSIDADLQAIVESSATHGRIFVRYDKPRDSCHCANGGRMSRSAHSSDSRAPESSSSRSRLISSKMKASGLHLRAARRSASSAGSKFREAATRACAACDGPWGNGDRGTGRRCARCGARPPRDCLPVCRTRSVSPTAASHGQLRLDVYRGLRRRLTQ